MTHQALFHQYRLVFDKSGKLNVIEIDAKEKNLKPSKIIGKTTLRKSKTQLNLNDGSNLLVDKDEFKLNDTVLVDIDKKKIIIMPASLSLKNYSKNHKSSWVKDKYGKRRNSIC